MIFPTFSARCLSSPADSGFPGLICLGLETSRIFLFIYQEENKTIRCDIDNVVFDESALIVSVKDCASHAFQLSSSQDLLLLKDAISACNDIFNLSLRINIAIHDCFDSGIRCGGIAPSAIAEQLRLSHLYRFATEDLPKCKTEEPAPIVCTAPGTTIAAPERKIVPRKAPKKCFFCQIGEKKYREDHFIEHPYVSCDFKGVPINMCLNCVSAWKTYRDAAEEADELFLPGESNEELCALCSVLPDTLVMCASCPRSYCECCLSIIMGQAELKKMKTENDWKCMECASSKKIKNKPAEKIKSPVALKIVAVEKKIEVAKPEAVAKKRGRNRNTAISQTDAPTNKPQNGDSTILPPVAKNLDELFYFGQYLNEIDTMYRTEPTCSVDCRGVAPSRGHGKNAETMESEDFCLLCKDGGDLLECDYVQKIFSEVYTNTEVIAIQPLGGIKIDESNIRSSRCRKVYHTYCLGFIVDDDYWQCPRHYCAAGTCRERPYFSCDICTTSFCKLCAIKWGEKQGCSHKYVEIARVLEYCGDEENPTAPNNECIRIVCDTCIKMSQQCIDRGEDIPETMIRILRCNMKSFNRKSDLYDVSNSLLYTPEAADVSIPKSSSGRPANRALKRQKSG